MTGFQIPLALKIKATPPVLQFTHGELCHRAACWLRSRRCEPVFADVHRTNHVGSCAEHPDAIGWSSSCKHHEGSTVIECKTSVGDFLADRVKYWRWRRPPTGDEQIDRLYSGLIPNSRGIRQLEADGYIRCQVPSMGNFRYFLSEQGIITPELIQKHRPDHGLLHIRGRRIQVVITAPERDAATVDLASEIRYLRFAIINGKCPIGGGI